MQHSFIQLVPQDKKAAEAAQRESEKAAAPAPAPVKAPAAYVPPAQPVQERVPPPTMQPEPVKFKEPEPAPAPPAASYTRAPEPEPEPEPELEPEPVKEPEPEPEPEPAYQPPVQQMREMRVEEFEQPPSEPQAQEEEPSMYANVEVARGSAAEEPAPATGEPAAPVLFVAEALYDYQASAEDELEFHAGDRINVIQKVLTLTAHEIATLLHVTQYPFSLTLTFTHVVDETNE